jgi:hypothetical protein
VNRTSVIPAVRSCRVIGGSPPLFYSFLLLLLLLFLFLFSSFLLLFPFLSLLFPFPFFIMSSTTIEKKPRPTRHMNESSCSLFTRRAGRSTACMPHVSDRLHRIKSIESIDIILLLCRGYDDIIVSFHIQRHACRTFRIGSDRIGSDRINIHPIIYYLYIR